MHLAGVVCLLLVVGCSFDHGQLNARIDGDVSMIDSPTIDGPPGCKSFTTHLDTCTQLLAGDPLSLAGANIYDTDTLTLSTPTQDSKLPNLAITTPEGDYVVVFVSSFNMQGGSTLRVVGNSLDRPLGIVATEAVTIAGAIDLTNNGAGARNDSDCGTQVAKKGEADSGGGGGGGGGAFAGAGGKGGNGDMDGGVSMGGDAGVAVTMRPTHVLGGCDGGPGGDGNAADTGGGAGDGGGAIFIASAVSIAISGSINAGGGGGFGGKSNGGGGGGGGSGGMIVLESKSISIAGKLAANGGGGGEGADGARGDNGATGGLTTTRAAGGSGNAPEGADGGAGGAGANAAGLAPTQLKKGGGGGAGGGVGFIAIGGSTPVTAGNTVISPPYQAWP